MAKDAKQLTPKQLRFVDEYLKDLNGTQAALRSGFGKNAKSASTIADRLLGNVGIRRLLAERTEKMTEKAGSTAEAVLLEAARHTHSDLRKLFDKQGNLLPIHELPDDIAQAIKSFEVVENPRRGADGEMFIERVRKVQFWEKAPAMAILAKYHRLVPDQVKVEHSGLTPAKARKMSDAELADYRRGLAIEAEAILAKLRK